MPILRGYLCFAIGCERLRVARTAPGQVPSGFWRICSARNSVGRVRRAAASALRTRHKAITVVTPGGQLLKSKLLAGSRGHIDEDRRTTWTREPATSSGHRFNEEGRRPASASGHRSPGRWCNRSAEGLASDGKWSSFRMWLRRRRAPPTRRQNSTHPKRRRATRSTKAGSAAQRSWVARNSATMRCASSAHLRPNSARALGAVRT